jgi:predicted signal transduction protein with EAL and GGDEF domain
LVNVWLTPGDTHSVSAWHSARGGMRGSVSSLQPGALRADRHLLSSLQSFPFDKIKIDRTFVAGVDHNGQSQARVRAVIGLGKALNVPVIAEGVESRRRTHVLEARGLRRDPGLRHRLSIENYAELTSDRDAGEHAMVS